MMRHETMRVPTAIALWLGLLLIPTMTGASASVSSGAGTADDEAPAATDPGRYSNPLLPEVPGDGTVESCADPTVIHGQEPGDTTWYLYCTTDPLNDEDLDAEGNLVFHRIPTMTSEDLVDWTYVGDAFEGGAAGLPDWAEDDAALWAPEVVYSTTHSQYYLFFVVTDTDAAVSGAEDCGSDSAIGVATGQSATGPWTFSDAPVVAPRSAGEGCNFLWTYDPDVLGDSVDDTSTLYYGSYFGGVYGTSVTLTADGATIDEAGAVMVGIDNKYEGANVVYRDGFYWMFLSATNCCNGALTGYSVFVGRSTSPLGPFEDQQGNLLTDPQAGGTPFLTMNGNRWVGTGHNTVFQDAHGDWWTIYHAVDQADPFFETVPGFTKRPALLDGIDWVDGWPTVNGGRGASARTVPAPAGQPGEKSRHDVAPVTPVVPGRTLPGFSDDFDGSALDDAWTWEWAGDEAAQEPPPPPANSVVDGSLRVAVEAADLYVDVDNAHVLLRDAPRRNYLLETKVRVDVPDEGCCFNYAQAGALVYADEDNYVKLADASIWNTRQTEFAKELNPVPTGWARYGNTVVGPPSEDWTYLRIAVRHLSERQQAEAGGDTEGYRAFTSQDGVNWVRGGTWTHTLGADGQLALAAFGLQAADQDFTAEFDYLRVSTLPRG